MVEEFTPFNFHCSGLLCARAVLPRFDLGEIAFRRSSELSTSDYLASVDKAFGAFLSED